MALDTQAMFDLLSRYGYLIVAIAALSEALPLVGLLVPGQAIIILAGAVAATGTLDLKLLILISIPAGIAGDALGFYLGRRYGRSFLETYGRKLRITDKHLQKSDALFEKYGPFALVVARFSFLTRAVGPILAGMSRMRQRIFWPINVLGAILWSVSYAVMGYFFGVAFLSLQAVIGRVLTLTAISVVALYVFYRILKRKARRFTGEDLAVAVMGVAGGALFGVLTDRVARLGSANALDRWVLAFPERLGGFAPALDVAAWLASPLPVGIAALMLLAWLAWRRQRWEAVLVGLGVGGAIVLVEVLRPLFAAGLAPEYALTGGYPSRAATLAVVSAGVLCYLVAERSRRAAVTLAFSVGSGVLVAAALLSGLARGAAYPSAALAGLFLGLGWLGVSILIVEFGIKKAAPPGMP